jgi:multidrug efflux system outer membrane protein
MNYKNNILWIFVATAITFAACRVGAKYQQPSLLLPAAFDTVRGDSGGIAEMNRNIFFKDETLQRLIDTGLNYNQDLLIAINRLDIARRRMAQSSLLQLPNVDLQFSGQYNRPSKNSLSGISANSFLGKSHIENYLAIATVSWEADIWGRLRGLKEAAVAEYLQQAEAAKAVQTQLVADIAQGYYNLLILDRQLEIAKSNLLLSDSFVRATRMLKDAGVVSQVAVEQAESQRQATEILIPQLEQTLTLQENALQLLTGKLPDRVLRGTLEESELAPELSTGFPVEMVSRRPDVRAAEMALVAANARVGVAKAGMYPALNITAGAGLESFKSSNWFNIPGSLFGLAAGTIAQPVFRRNALKTEYEVAKLEREQAVTRFRQQVLIAVTEVSNALVQVEKLEEQQKIAIAQADTLNTASKNARLLFGSDMASYLEVLTAQGNSLQAQLNVSAISRSQLSARIELYRALGGGWK